MTRQRDYRAEYATRIARGAARGLSRSQARGHPRPEEAGRASRGTTREYDRRLEAAFRDWRATRQQIKSARRHHVAPERLREFGKSSRLVRRYRGRWQFLKDKRIRNIPLYSDASFIVVHVRGFDLASKAQRYMADVGRFLNTNKIDYLRKWVGEGVEDIDGRWHPFETRPNLLYRLNATEHTPFEQIYRVVA